MYVCKTSLLVCGYMNWPLVISFRSQRTSSSQEVFNSISKHSVAAQPQRPCGIALTQRDRGITKIETGFFKGLYVTSLSYWFQIHESLLWAKLWDSEVDRARRHQSGTLCNRWYQSGTYVGYLLLPATKGSNGPLTANAYTDICVCRKRSIGYIHSKNLHPCTSLLRPA